MQVANPRFRSLSARKSVDSTRYKNPDDDARGPYLLVDVTSPFERPKLQYEWNGSLPPAGRSWRYTKERAEALEAEGRITFSPTGRPRLKRYLDEAIGEAAIAQIPPTTSYIELIVRTAMREIVVAVAKNPDCLRAVEWRDLERALREVFEGLGFTTKLTRSGNDGGFDLELKYAVNGKDKKVLVEVKHWAGSGKKPGKPIFKSLVEVVARALPGTTGLLLSSTGFTSDLVTGRTEIEKKSVRLGGKAKIISLCQSYLQTTEGIWAPTTDLAEMLQAGTQ
jgi:hypothetical protein